MNVTGAMHPKTMMPVVSIHGLAQQMAGGDPKALRARETAVQKTFAIKGEPRTKVARAVAATGRGAAAVAQAAGTKGVVGQAAQQTRTPPTTVRMETPDGQIRDIPADKVNEAKQRGAKMVQ